MSSKVTKPSSTKMKIVLHVMYSNGSIKEHNLCKGVKYNPLLLNALDRLNCIPYNGTSLAYPLSIIDILDYTLNSTVGGDFLSDYLYKSFCKINKTSYNKEDYAKKLKVTQFYELMINDVKRIRFFKAAMLNHLYIEDFEEHYSDVAWIPFKYYPDLDSYGFVPKIGSNIISLKFHAVI